MIKLWKSVFKSALFLAAAGSLFAPVVHAATDIKWREYGKEYYDARNFRGIESGIAVPFGQWKKTIYSDGAVMTKGKVFYHGAAPLAGEFGHDSSGIELQACHPDQGRLVCDVRYVYVGQAPKRLNFGYPNLEKSAAGVQVPIGPWADFRWKVGGATVHNLVGTVEIRIPQWVVKRYGQNLRGHGFGQNGFSEQDCAPERHGRTECQIAASYTTTKKG